MIERVPSSAGKEAPRSLVYGLGLLRAFTAEHPVRGVSELAELLGVSRPTAHRYAATCLDLGYLERAPMRRYRLARRAAELGIAVVDSLPPIGAARPILRALRDDTGRTASLAVLDGDAVVYPLRLRGFARGQYGLEQGIGPGTRLPAEDAPAGIALRAAREGGRGDIASGELAVHAFRAITDGWGLAIVVGSTDVDACALELTVPKRTASDPRELARLSQRLRGSSLALAARTQTR